MDKIMGAGFLVLGVSIIISIIGAFVGILWMQAVFNVVLVAEGVSLLIGIGIFGLIDGRKHKGGHYGC